MNMYHLSISNFRIKRLLMRYSLVTFTLINLLSSRALAETVATSPQAAPQENTSERRRQSGELIKIVREAAERFKEVSVAESEGYALQFGCVTGPDWGAMGLHYVNSELVNKGVLDPYHPQIVIYEPKPGGGLRLIGADYLLMAEPWDKKKQGPPELMGQLFHYFETPNRFGLPAFYTLHVWAWKDNPNGAFVNWHPKVSCEFFSPQNPWAGH